MCVCTRVCVDKNERETARDSSDTVIVAFI